MHKLDVSGPFVRFGSTFYGKHLAEYSGYFSNEFRDWLIEENISALVSSISFIDTNDDLRGTYTVTMCVTLEFAREADMLYCKMRWL